MGSVNTWVWNLVAATPDLALYNRRMRAESPSTVEQYLAEIPSDAMREALERLRRIIKEEAPEAPEGISYQIPTFKLNGMLASYAAFAKHCSFFPGGVVPEFEEELKEFKTSKGTIQFTPDRPIPEALVRKIIQARVAANAAKSRR